MSKITVSFVLDTAKVSKFGMGVVSVDVPAGFALAGKLAWAVEQGTLAVKAVKAAKEVKAAAAPAGMSPEMMAAFAQFMAAQNKAAPVAAPAKVAPAKVARKAKAA